MNGPPTKRFRGLDQDGEIAVAFDDTFGDDDEFTQADLEEIDIIASQAITSAMPEPKPAAKPSQPAHGSPWTTSAGPSKPLSRAASSHSRENTFGFSKGKAGQPIREPLGELRGDKVVFTYFKSNVFMTGVFMNR